MFVPSPLNKQQANWQPAPPALIKGTLPLPGLSLLRSKSYLEQLYSRRHLSPHEIARLNDASLSGVLEALDRFGIPQNGNGRTHPGQLRFGFD
jgi:hypothetical protein